MPLYAMAVITSYSIHYTKLYEAIVDGISKPGDYVDMKAEMDTLVLVSNCPQLNNPCNAYDPSPIQMVIWNVV